jgi:uncharacterized protein (TIGR03663 family)
MPPASRRLPFAVGIWLIAAAALALRLPQLSARPMHGDEANQAVRTGLLLETGVYRYDPEEHHGPSLYYLTLPAVWLSGARDFAATDEFAYRVVPAVFGAGLIVLLLLVADGLGRSAALCAAVLTAISPAMVFYSRYYIQETLLVFFTAAACGCAWRYVRTRSLGWALAAGTTLGLMHATKETWVIAAAAMVCGLVFAVLWLRWRDRGATSLGDQGRFPVGLGDTTRPARRRDNGLPPLRDYFRPLPLLGAVLAAGAVVVVFYSSWGTHWRGVLDSILAYLTYWQRGRGGGEAAMHSHPWYFYLELLVAYRPARGFFWSEGLIVGLGLVGTGVVLGRRRPTALTRLEDDAAPAEQAFGPFLAAYTLTLTLLYAAIPYKTPWCLLSFLQGLILLAGVGAAWLVRRLPGWPAKAIAALLLVVGVTHLGWQAYRLNTRFCADTRNPYVYAHSSGDVVQLARQLDRLAEMAPEGHDLMIHVVTPENYWPLPWYLRRFNRNHVGYWQDVAAWQHDTQSQPPPAIVIHTADVQEPVDARLRGEYQRMYRGLRPDVLLTVCIREDLWQGFVAAPAKPR